MSNRKVRVGLVGCGKIAETHAGALATLDAADFVACCDPVLARAQDIAGRYGAGQAFAELASMIEENDLEALLVCTPHPTHEAVVLAAAAAGLHVLCEKPIAIDLEQATRMVNATDKAGVKFGVVFQRRFWPAAQRIRQAIDSGRLGKPALGECSVKIWRSEAYFASDPWRGTWANEGGGVLMNQAVHAIDLFQWFMGPAVEVHGQYATLRHGDYIDVEDTAVATVRFASGALGTILAATTYQPQFGYRVEVHGDSGATVSVWENPEGTQGVNDLWTFDGEEQERAAWEAEEKGNPGFPLFHTLQIEDFLQAIVEDHEPAVTGREARKSLEIILAIYESSRSSLPVSLRFCG